MTNDVEKRWHDPGALRAAMVYVAAVVALAVGTFVVYALGDRNELGWALATPVASSRVVYESDLISGTGVS
jgi:hypothetical protein